MTTCTASLDSYAIRVDLPEWPGRPNTVVTPSDGLGQMLYRLRGVHQVHEVLICGTIVVIVHATEDLEERTATIQRMVQRFVNYTLKRGRNVL